MEPDLQGASMTRIDDTFARLRSQGKKAFVAYIMGGDPDEATSLAVMQGLPAAGVDVIDLGMGNPDFFRMTFSFGGLSLGLTSAGQLHTVGLDEFAQSAGIPFSSCSENLPR